MKEFCTSMETARTPYVFRALMMAVVLYWILAQDSGLTRPVVTFLHVPCCVSVENVAVFSVREYPEASYHSSVRIARPSHRTDVGAVEVLPGRVVVTAVAASASAVDELLFTVINESNEQLSIPLQDSTTCLRLVFCPLLHSRNSRLATEEKAQQLPHCPWFLMAGMQASVRQSSCIT